MLTSNRFAKITKLTLAFIVAVATGTLVSPAFAQSLYQRDGTDANRHVVRQHVEPTLRKNGRGAYGMIAGPSSQLDRYSPAANGGGSYGYNEKLLSY